MDFKATNTKKAAPRFRAGFTLIEIMFTVGITSLCLGVLAMFFVFSTHSFTTLYNYVDLDDVNRIAMDRLTRDVRQANSVTNFTTNTLVLLTGPDNHSLTYTYDSTGRTLTRAEQFSTTSVLLKECDRLSFVVGQRNMQPGTWDSYTNVTAPTAYLTAKVINVSWSCSRKVFGLQEDTESVQTARIVIRKQGT